VLTAGLQAGGARVQGVSALHRPESHAGLPAGQRPRLAISTPNGI
jgi:hypothetical protein